MELVIITGMSGAGKSNAANALEDIGFYCIDNIPPLLIPEFVKLSKRGQNVLSKVAIVTDTRGGEMFADVNDVLDSLKETGVEYKILFLDASDDSLVRRYKETRRRHPLCEKSPDKTVLEAVQEEREILKSVRLVSDYIIDTSFSPTGVLKKRLTNLFLGDHSKGLVIQCVSFGFKYGNVAEADLVFDVRCLKNPYYVDELRMLTGLDDSIREFVLDLPQTAGLLERLIALIDYSVPLYCDEGKSQLVIAIGCTGGKHRSVVFAEMIYGHLMGKGYRVSVNHRDIIKA